MTVEEFQTRYHDYQTTDSMEALSDAMKLRVLDEKGKEVKIVPVKLGDSWCLMVETAAKFLEESGVVGKAQNE